MASLCFCPVRVYTKKIDYVKSKRGVFKIFSYLHCRMEEVVKVEVFKKYVWVCFYKNKIPPYSSWLLSFHMLFIITRTKWWIALYMWGIACKVQTASSDFSIQKQLRKGTLLLKNVIRSGSFVCPQSIHYSIVDLHLARHAGICGAARACKLRPYTERLHCAPTPWGTVLWR